MTPLQFRKRFNLTQEQAAKLFNLSRRGWQLAESRETFAASSLPLARLLWTYPRHVDELLIDPELSD